MSVITARSRYFLCMMAKVIEPASSTGLVPYGTEQRPFRKPVKFQKTALHPNCCHVPLRLHPVRGLSDSWFQNYLCTCFQRVKFKELSSSLPLNNGVPKDSILGPLIFMLYINDLPQCLVRFNISMYADDTVIYTTGLRPDES